MINLKQNKILLIFFILIITACQTSDEYPSKSNMEAKRYYDMARDDYKDGQYKRAIRNLDKAIRLDSENSRYFTKRGDCYRKLRKPNDAISDYDEALRISKSNARAYYHRGTLKIILGKKKSGCLDIKKAKSLAYIPANNYYKEHCE